MKLYEHTEALRVVEEWILEHDTEIRAAEGALPEELAQLLEAAQMGFKDKAERVGLMVLEFTTTAKSIDAEIKRLQARKAHFEKAASGLKEYLRLQLQQAGEQKIKGGLVTMWRQLAAPSVKCDLTQDQLAALYEDGFGQLDDEHALIVREETVRYAIDRDVALELAAHEQPLPGGITVARTEYLRVQ